MISRYHVGGVILFSRNIQDARQVLELTRSMQGIAKAAGHRYPLFIAIDQENGSVQRLGPSATQFPAISFKRGVTDHFYKDRSALLWDVVEIMKADLGQLSLEGVSYIQLDAPRAAPFGHQRCREDQQFIFLPGGQFHRTRAPSSLNTPTPAADTPPCPTMPVAALPTDP